MSDTYEDLGNGWFFTHEHNDGQAYIADANASEPDHFFGPMAWRGRCGPGSGRTLVRLRYVDLDAYRVAVDAAYYDNAPDPGECPVWPARTEITEAGVQAGLKGLEPIYDSEVAFLTAVRALPRVAGASTMHTTDRRERLALAEHLIPGAAVPRRH